ncbi:hypothetical protein [Oscillatoria acuminata]|uniref:Uncharacterized protein n=1 Tax=Oscillatoria acuminata PCC 6304 TaxID=56110 RepID=K9TCN2_9CYAN|nr:hypothetical protein [Oscillatoria acuminata]AFY79876.1 hypothetical protein Oscil6304_0119 [Oscillatoria acuminata PCC 6304]
MKDSDAIIVKAFLAALAQLSEPLPAHLQEELQTLSKTQKFTDLVLFARKHEPLKLAYQQANTQFTEQGNQYRKGLDILPDAYFEKASRDNSEIINVASDSSELNTLPKVLAKINERWPGQPDIQSVKQIFKSPNSVESAKTFLLYPEIPNF